MDVHRAVEALEPVCATRLELVPAVDQPGQVVGDVDAARCGRSLDAGGDVDGLPQRERAGPAAGSDVADDDRAGVQPGSDVESEIALVHRRDGGERRSDLPARAVVVGGRVAEQHQEAISHQVGDVPAVPLDHLGYGVEVRPDGVAEVLRVEPGRERRGANEIAEHHREVALFGVARRQRLRRRVEGLVGRVGGGGSLGGDDVGRPSDEYAALEDRVPADRGEFVDERVEIVVGQAVLALDEAE
jgi:hypothetical protein